MKKILAIDGGGIRGIIPGQLLHVLEDKLRQKTGKVDARLPDFFDFFAGTSTGGILISLLLCPDETKPLRPRFSAAEAVDMYRMYGASIFRTSLWGRILNYKSMFSEKYHADPLESILEKYFGGARLSSLLKPCLITAYNIRDRKTHFFASHDFPRKGDGGDFYLRDVCRATSAAPTYFETALISSLSGVSYPMVDGGIFANNPALCAYSEVRNAKGQPTASDMFVVSLGTGGENRPYEYRKARRWGAMGWIKPSIDIMMSGAAETTHYHLLKMFSAGGNSANYIRIQPADLRNASPEMDNVRPANIAALTELGIKTAEDYSGILDEIVERVVADEDKVEF